MRSVKSQELTEHLAELLREVEGGDEVVIVVAGRPVARLVRFAKGGSAYERPRRRVLGRDAGRFTIPESFYDPLPEAELQSFEA